MNNLIIYTIVVAFAGFIYLKRNSIKRWWCTTSCPHNCGTRINKRPLHSYRNDHWYFINEQCDGCQGTYGYDYRAEKFVRMVAAEKKVEKS